VKTRKPGPIVFGSFNSFAKANDPLLELWSKILLAVPDSRLLLKSSGAATHEARERIDRFFGAHSVDPKRIEMLGRNPKHADHLALYQRLDIALDTFPYHGTTTTCESLWMGVPVVTLAGEHHVSRVGVSLLTNVGLPELIASNRDQYVDIAVQLAKDPRRLAELRAWLRDRMQASPLRDGSALAANIESVYRKIWEDWCDRTTGSNFNR
jgi:predicted O-linked N-acetylglucosamine transferase (SPINDLY family)